LSSTQLTQKATDTFKALYTRTDVQGVQITATYNTATRVVTVSGAGWIKPDFMGVMGVSAINISTNGAAKADEGGSGCVLALNGIASGAGTSQGSTKVNLKGCSLYDNSKHASALT